MLSVHRVWDNWSQQVRGRSLQPQDCLTPLHQTSSHRISPLPTIYPPSRVWNSTTPILTRTPTRIWAVSIRVR